MRVENRESPERIQLKIRPTNMDAIFQKAFQVVNNNPTARLLGEPPSLESNYLPLFRQKIENDDLLEYLEIGLVRGEDSGLFSLTAIITICDEIEFVTGDELQGKEVPINIKTLANHMDNVENILPAGYPSTRPSGENKFQFITASGSATEYHIVELDCRLTRSGERSVDIHVMIHPVFTWNYLGFDDQNKKMTLWQMLEDFNKTICRLILNTYEICNIDAVTPRTWFLRAIDDAGPEQEGEYDLLTT